MTITNTHLPLSTAALMRQIKGLALALLALAWLGVSPAFATITVVHKADATQTGGSGTQNLTIANPATTTGNAVLVICSSYQGTGANLISASDGVNTYTQIIAPFKGTGTTVQTGVWVAMNITGTSSSTVNCNSASGGSNVLAGSYAELTNVKLTSAIDTALSNTGLTASTTSPSITGSASNVQANEFVCGLISQDNIAATITEDGAYTNLGNTFPVSGSSAQNIGCKNTTSIASQTYAPTSSGATIFNTAIFALEDVTPGGGGGGVSLLGLHK